MGEREQIINFLLQSCDGKIAQIAELQKVITGLQNENTELKKSLAALSPPTAVASEA